MFFFYLQVRTWFRICYAKLRQIRTPIESFIDLDSISVVRIRNQYMIQLKLLEHTLLVTQIYASFLDFTSGVPLVLGLILSYSTACPVTLYSYSSIVLVGPSNRVFKANFSSLITELESRTIKRFVIYIQ